MLNSDRYDTCWLPWGDDHVRSRSTKESRVHIPVTARETFLCLSVCLGPNVKRNGTNTSIWLRRIDPSRNPTRVWSRYSPTSFWKKINNSCIVLLYVPAFFLLLTATIEIMMMTPVLTTLIGQREKQKTANKPFFDRQMFYTQINKTINAWRGIRA